MATKILVTGDIQGHFTSLFTRVSKVHTSKAGPFHALLCVGQFFGRSAESQAELEEFITGKKEIPLPTYFITGDEFHHKYIDGLPVGGELCKNLIYLGRSGVASLELGGKKLNVAYLSGVYDQSSYFNTMQSSGGTRLTHYQSHYIEEDVVTVLAAGVQKEVDILLTSEWGRGWQTLLPNEKIPQALQNSSVPHGSPVVAKLASQIPARYHFAGSMDTYLELPPYRSRLFVTRFFGLGAVDSPKKEKSLYACNVASFATIDKTAIPADVTPCPYTVGTAKPTPPTASSSTSSTSSPAISHSFPSDPASNKRQKLDTNNSFTNPNAAEVASGDAVGLATHRWNFAKPERGPPPASYICRICQEPGHWIETCPKKVDRNPADRDTPPANYICKKCNQGGHFIRLCPLILAENAAGGVRGPRPPPSDYVCARCNQPGHWIKECTAPKTVPPNYICKVCHQGGHFIADCEVVKKENAERDALRAAKRVPLLGAGPRGLDANGLPVGTDAECWFCLASEHVSTHLILSVGNENYLALAKGALNEEHVLILPIVHVSSSLDLTADQLEEMDKYKLALRKYYASKGLECIMYERYIPTRAAQHMHIQVLPVTRDQAKQAKSLLHQQSKALDESLTFQEIPKQNTLLQANPGKQPFIVFEFPSVEESTSTSASNTTAFPLDRFIHYVHHQKKIFGLFDFPRSFLATLIGQPEKSDWKKATRQEIEETEMVEKMKETFQLFDFTLNEESTAASDHQPQPMITEPTS